MKKYITLLFLVAAIRVNAQVPKIKSKVLGDSLVRRDLGCVEMTPIIVTPAGDTARTFRYTIIFQRDTTATVLANVDLFDKKGTLLSSISVSMPGAAYRKWGLLLTPIDAFLHTTYARFVKQ